MEREKQFNAIATEAEQILKQTEGKINESLKGVWCDDLEKMTWEVIVKTAHEFISTLLVDLSNVGGGETFETQEIHACFAAELPPELYEAVLKEILKNKRWEECEKLSLEQSHSALFIFLSRMVEHYRETETDRKKNGRHRPDSTACFSL